MLYIMLNFTLSKQNDFQFNSFILLYPTNAYPIEEIYLFIHPLMESIKFLPYLLFLY